MNDLSLAMSRKDYLRRLLCPFWLRAESALWYAHEAFLVRQYLGAHLEQPSMELGCMDGTSTFIMLGGEFGIGFDVYSEVSWSKESKAWQSLADDYYNTYKSDSDRELDIRARPIEGFEVGLSWKKTHLQKAARLGIYHKLVEHNPNTPLEMFENGCFATIWAPNLYWIDNLNGLMRELRRVIKEDGRLITILPDSAALNHMLYRFVDQADPAWIKDLDRGRYSNVARQARTLGEWTKVFDGAGLRITKHDRFLPKLVFQVNDIGMRPMFPVMMQIYEILRQHQPADWADIKEHWIETAFHFLAPLCEIEWMERMEQEKVWHIFELEPTNKKLN
jgi:SAM-dependent methyltransferase